MIIDKQSRVPIYEQIIIQYKTLIACDALQVGDKLESVRSLSSELGINPNTIQKAYTELENQWICKSVPGRGRFVTADAKIIIKNIAKQNTEKLNKIVYSLVLFGMNLEEINNLTKNAFLQAQKSMNKIKSE